jgi:hypothetical protein
MAWHGFDVGTALPQVAPLDRLTFDGGLCLEKIRGEL